MCYFDSSSFFVSDLSVGGFVAWHSASSRLATANRSWSRATLSAAREPIRASTFPSSISAIADRVIWPFERRASALVERPIAVLRERIAAPSIDANAARGRSSFLPIVADAIGILFSRVGKRSVGRSGYRSGRLEGLDQVEDSQAHPWPRDVGLPVACSLARHRPHTAVEPPPLTHAHR
jgi:hypothetical protein